jgi:uncharacterized protein (TIGR02145 family)
MKKKTTFLIAIVYIFTGIYSYTYSQETGSFTDARDGKVYKTVKIDEQVWMGENLAFKTESGCWVYDDIKDYAKTHGYLYSWEVATKACPDGWHLPSMQDWWFLSNFLGGDDQSGGKLKQTGTTSWKSPNTGATNSSGFTALSSGRNGDKNMEYIGSKTFFWTNVDDDDVTSWCGELSSSSGALSLYPVDKSDGYSVRCIKNSDNPQENFDFW